MAIKIDDNDDVFYKFRRIVNILNNYLNLDSEDTYLLQEVSKMFSSLGSDVIHSYHRSKEFYLLQTLQSNIDHVSSLIGYFDRAESIQRHLDYLIMQVLDNRDGSYIKEIEDEIKKLEKIQSHLLDEDQKSVTYLYRHRLEHLKKYIESSKK